MQLFSKLDILKVTMSIGFQSIFVICNYIWQKIRTKNNRENLQSSEMGDIFDFGPLNRICPSSVYVRARAYERACVHL